MTTRDENTKGTAGADSGGAAIDAMEQRVLAFAEQLGRIVGTVQAKAEGWMDRDALKAQIAGVRDSAADLLVQLGGGKKTAPAKLRQTSGAATSDSTKTTGATARPAAKTKPSAKGKVASKARASATSGAPATGAGRGRSGGAVDAPGKKHRKPMPSESAATGNPRGAGARIAKLKLANESRIMRRRG